MLKKLLLTMSLMAVFIDPCYAKGVCSTSKYKLLDDTIDFGTTQAKTLSQLRAKYQHKNNVAVYQWDYKGRPSIIFVPGQTFVVVQFMRVQDLRVSKQIIYMFTAGVMTRVMHRYSFFTPEETLKALYLEQTAKYGEPNSTTIYPYNTTLLYYEEGRYEWSEDGGLELNLLVSEEAVSIRFDCVALERVKESKATTKSANFGF